jgi:hypothetical protein
VFRRYWGLAVASTLGLAAAVVLCWHAAAPTFADLKRDGNQMVAAVERFRETNGRYPETLAEAGVVPPPTRYGAWGFEWDGGEYVLSIGDYGRDGFVLYYSSRNRDWYADT